MLLQEWSCWLLGALAALFGVVEQVGILLAILADEHQIIALRIRTVLKITRLAMAVRALTDRLRVIAELYGHAIVKYAQTTLPKAIIAVLFAVFHDTAIDLIDILETALFHHA